MYLTNSRAPAQPCLSLPVIRPLVFIARAAMGIFWTNLHGRWHCTGRPGPLDQCLSCVALEVAPGCVGPRRRPPRTTARDAMDLMWMGICFSSQATLDALPQEVQQSIHAQHMVSFRLLRPNAPEGQAGMRRLLRAETPTVHSEALTSGTVVGGGRSCLLDNGAVVFPLCAKCGREVLNHICRVLMPGKWRHAPMRMPLYSHVLSARKTPMVRAMKTLFE